MPIMPVPGGGSVRACSQARVMITGPKAEVTTTEKALASPVTDSCLDMPLDRCRGAWVGKGKEGKEKAALFIRDLCEA